jgi:hypothetical protein
LIGTIAQQLDDGRLRVEHSAPVLPAGQKPQLVTLTAIVSSKQFTTTVLPAGTAIYSTPQPPQPGDKPTITTTDTNIVSLPLADLKGVKIRTWTLSEELGE